MIAEMKENARTMIRRLPVYLVLDTSESMRGEALEAVRRGLKMLVSELRMDPQAMESVWLSVITFGNTVQQVCPLTELATFQDPTIEANGASALGDALEELLKCADRELVKTTVGKKGDYKPLVFLMTSGQPTDSWEQAADKVKSKRWNIIACAAGAVSDESLLKRITESVVKLNDCQPGTLERFARSYWIDLDDDGPIKSESVPLTDPSPNPPPSSIGPDNTDEAPIGRQGKQIRKATLTDGREVEYVVDPDKIMEGGMKQFFFTPDKSAVLCFYKDLHDPTRRARLEAFIGKFNPTVGPYGEYWKRLFCWPTGMIQSPRLGVVCPTYPANFFFKDGPWKGKAKDGTWFTGRTGGGKSFRDLMPESERGPWINYFKACIMLARAVKCLHKIGLAHSDLSPRNVLFDPYSGQCMLLGCDELVVPGIFPPNVMGSPGYIAPEVLATCHLPITDPNRKHPCVGTDQFALAVLIYQFLLIRHPLKGPKLNSMKSAEEDDLLSMGEKALFIEHPTDRTNRPPDKELGVSYEALGLHLVSLFNEVFVNGLHAPNRRPTAYDWETQLLKTWDLLHPCPNPACTHQRFVVWKKGAQRCPFCGATVAGGILKFNFRKESRPGTWLQDGELVIYNGVPLMKWHVYDNVQPNESLSDAERSESLADCQFYGGKWLLINRKIEHMVSPKGNQIEPNTAVELKPGARIRLSTEPHGRIAEVEVIQDGAGG